MRDNKEISNCSFVLSLVLTPLNRPSKRISSSGACTWKIALKYKVKQSKNGKFTSNYKASPIGFETQIFLRRKAPPKISPSKI